MKKLLLVLALLSSPVSAQNIYEKAPSSTCTESDWIGIEDEGHGIAVVTYSNSIESCSEKLDMIITSPNGISVRVQIIIGGAETIIITPQDPTYRSDPNKADVEDGDKEIFYITGGTS